jgi:hypothetical protein
MLWILALLFINARAQEDHPEAKPERRRRSKRFNSAYQILMNSTNVLDKVTGRDIILILGQSQIGKSTAINAMRGVKFQWAHAPGGNSKPGLVPAPTDTKVAPMGRGVQHTTEKPEVYEGIPGLLLVDTRGVGELGTDETGKLAASILMEMICQAARSVRIVALVGFSQIEHIQNLDSVMQQIGNLIPDASSDVLWLFTRHYLNRAGSPLTKQSESQILQEIRMELENAWNGVKDIKPPARKSEPILIRAAQKTTIAAMREASLAQPCRIGYLDPTSEWSIEQSVDQIKRVPPIPVSNMRFGRDNRHRPIFETGLRMRLQRELTFFLKYLRLRLADIPSIFREMMQSHAE